MANVIHPQGYGPVSHQETRTTARSAQRCAVIWMAGLSVAIPAIPVLLINISAGLIHHLAIYGQHLLSEAVHHTR
jgi:hypothetical protein